MRCISNVADDAARRVAYSLTSPALSFQQQMERWDEPVTTGTTILAVEFDGGVVIGADSRTTSG